MTTTTLITEPTDAFTELQTGCERETTENESVRAPQAGAGHRGRADQCASTATKSSLRLTIPRRPIRRPPHHALEVRKET